MRDPLSEDKVEDDRGRFIHLWSPLHVYAHPQIKV